MKYPGINKMPRREVGIPQLSGGLNLRDGLTSVADNQLTDCINMWYKNGMLRSRPKYQSIKKTLLKQAESEILDCVIQRHNICFDNQYFISARYIDGTKQYINFAAVSALDIVLLPQITSDTSSYFLVLFGKELYCYTSNREIFKLTLPYNGEDEWSKITTDDVYIPIYITNGKSGKSLYSYEGSMFESVNLIGNKVKYYYSTVNPGVTDDGQCIMLYEFPIMKVDWISHIKATITDSKGNTVTHEMDINGSEIINYYESKHNSNWENVKDGLEMIVQLDKYKKGSIKRFALGFRYTDSASGTNHTVNGWGIIPKDAESIENNLEVIVTYDSIEEDIKTKDKIFSMRVAEWFGGASVGINGGTRLFLGGNTKDDEKSLILWSALNDPLYFPENNYAYIGEKNTSVTAFAKQSNMLVIFKENETYYTQYVKNENVTAESIINQSVIDYQANCVYFPITLIHATIGCDCAATVQLCRNRLVWTNSNGKVYTLVGDNQYSERNIYEIGEMVSNRIKNEDNLKNASSCDWEGYYALLVGGHMYLMDYNSNGYQYVSSYQKGEDANRRIPWYYWEFNLSSLNVTTFHIGELLMIVTCHSTRREALVYDLLILDVSDEKGTEIIRSGFATKLFDFAAGKYSKKINAVSIGFGADKVARINVKFITDMGNASETVLLDKSVDDNGARFVVIKNFYPQNCGARVFGVAVECEESIAVDSLTIDYRILGGVR